MARMLYGCAIIWLLGLMCQFSCGETLRKTRFVNCDILNLQNARLDEQLARIAANYVSLPLNDYVATGVTYAINGPCPWGNTTATVSFKYMNSSDTEEIALNIYDTTPPELQHIPRTSEHLPSQVQCLSDAVLLAAQEIPHYFGHLVTATDACTVAPTIAYSWSFAQATCINHGTMTLQWTAMDACGNAAYAHIPIRVWDTQPPLLRPNAIKRHCVYGGAKQAVCPYTAAHRIVTEALVSDNCDTSPKLLTTRAIHTTRYSCTAQKCLPVDTKFDVTACGLMTEGTMLHIDMRVADTCGNEYPGPIYVELVFVNSENTCQLYQLPAIPATAISAAML